MRFGMQHHIDLWKEKDARNPKKQFGVEVEGSWYWYDSWVQEVRRHCQANEALYRPAMTIAKPPAPLGDANPVGLSA